MVYWIRAFSAEFRDTACLDAFNEDGSRFAWPPHILLNGAKIDYDIGQGLRIEHEEGPGVPGMNSIFPLARLQRPKKSLPDLFMTTNRILMASGRFRDLLEELEPGRHQFFPVRILPPEGANEFAKRYIFNICTRLDCVADRSKNVERVVRARCCEGSHIWRDGPWGVEVYLSDKLFHEIRARKIKIAVVSYCLVKTQTI